MFEATNQLNVEISVQLPQTNGIPCSVEPVHNQRHLGQLVAAVNHSQKKQKVWCVYKKNCCVPRSSTGSWHLQSIDFGDVGTDIGGWGETSRPRRQLWASAVRWFHVVARRPDVTLVKRHVAAIVIFPSDDQIWGILFQISFRQANSATFLFILLSTYTLVFFEASSSPKAVHRFRRRGLPLAFGLIAEDVWWKLQDRSLVIR